MAWLQSNFPIREWFTLEQAVKEIQKQTNEDITIGDLLHFASLGLFEICLKVKITSDEAEMLNQKIQPMADLLNELKIFESDTSKIQIDEPIKGEYSYISFGESLNEFYYDGFIALESTYFNNLEFRLDKQFFPVNQVLWGTPPRADRIKNGDNFSIRITTKEPIQLSIDEFIILKDELIALSNGGMPRIIGDPRNFDEELEKIKSIPTLTDDLMERVRWLEEENKKLKEDNNELKKENKKLSSPNLKEFIGDVKTRTQTENKKSKFIKYLLAVAFDEDVANNPRYHIAEKDNAQGEKYSDGKIQVAFDHKGYLVPVTGKTLANWIADIELEKSN